MGDIMKKVSVLVIFSLLLLLASCTKVTKLNNENYGKIDYYVAGLYLELGLYEEFNLSDGNPKVYFDFSNSKYFGSFTTSTGFGATAVNFNGVAKNESTENGVIVYYGSTNVTIKNSDITSIKLYPIYVDKNNNVIVSKEFSEKLNIEDDRSYQFMVRFENNKQKYKVEINLKLNRRKENGTN